jgi:hypothetical protein
MPYFEDASLRVIFRAGFRVGFRTGFMEEDHLARRHTGDVRHLRWPDRSLFIFARCSNAEHGEK